GPQPAHVRVERYVPQSLLFPACDLVVTHGGYNTIMAALTHGLPLVLVPISADQPFQAQRCAEIGVGRVVPSRELTAEALRVAVPVTVPPSVISPGRCGVSPPGRSRAGSPSRSTVRRRRRAPGRTGRPRASRSRREPRRWRAAARTSAAGARRCSPSRPGCAG